MSSAARVLTLVALGLLALRAARAMARARLRPAPIRRGEPPGPVRREPPREAPAPPARREAEHEAPASRARTGELPLVVVAIGALLLLGVVVDLVVRGPDRDRTSRWVIAGTDPERGRAAILHHGCGSCHVIPGIRTARGRVGPQLVDFVNQTYVAGVLANEPENLVRWLMRPREVDPLTAMPDTGVTEQEARDIAAYLYETP